MHLLGIDNVEKVILFAIAIGLDVFWLRIWRITINMPTILKYTPKQRKLMCQSSWIFAWIAIMFLVFKYG